jgi:hypothetical protein
MSRRVAVISNIPPDFSTILGANYYDDWDFNNSASLSLTGSAINSITSSGSNGAVFSASGTARPTLVSADINGKDVASFDGVTDVMSVAASTAMYNFLHYGQGAIILVLKVNNTGGVKIVLSNARLTSHTGFEFYFTAAEYAGHSIYNTTATFLSALDSSDLSSSYSSVVGKVDTQNATAYNKISDTINNSYDITNSANANGNNANATFNLYLGARPNLVLYYSGSIARMIVINALPTATQLALIQKRLEYEYGIFPI